LEDFIFLVDAVKEGNKQPQYVRVRLLWHPADRVSILPEDFYTAPKRWQLTLTRYSPFHFVRELCEKPIPLTVPVDVDGTKVELARYVDPTILPPQAGVWANLSTAVRLRPRAADVPDPQMLPCFLLDKPVCVVAAPGKQK